MLTPEERELDKKRAELSVLETEIAQCELDLATFTAELRTFEARYLSIVGVRYAELDQIEAQIAEAIARLYPEQAETQQRAYDARAKAEKSTEAIGDFVGIKEPDDFKPPDSLKCLYRELSKQIHPDLVTDEKQRVLRRKLMAEANLAYERQDENHLLNILNNWESSPESVRGDGTGAELVRIIRKLAQVNKRLEEIKAEMALLSNSELNVLKAKVTDAGQRGRDLFNEMAEQVNDKIKDAQKRLDGITCKGTEK